MRPSNWVLLALLLAHGGCSAVLGGAGAGVGYSIAGDHEHATTETMTGLGIGIAIGLVFDVIIIRKLRASSLGPH